MNPTLAAQGWGTPRAVQIHSCDNLSLMQVAMALGWADGQFEALKKLAEDRFATLSEAENKMIRAAVARGYGMCSMG